MAAVTSHRCSRGESGSGGVIDCPVDYLHTDATHQQEQQSTNKSHLVFIIQRYDVEYFRLYAERDPIFAKKVFKAMKYINLHVFKVKWDVKKGCYGWKSVPILWWIK